MKLFNSRVPETRAPRREQSGGLPILPIDLSKRYDVYCSLQCHDRLYENVKFVCTRTLDRPDSGMPSISEFIEIEATDGSKSLIPKFGIHLICEHGTKPAFTVLRRRSRK